MSKLSNQFKRTLLDDVNFVICKIEVLEDKIEIQDKAIKLLREQRDQWIDALPNTCSSLKETAQIEVEKILAGAFNVKTP